MKRTLTLAALAAAITAPATFAQQGTVVQRPPAPGTAVPGTVVQRPPAPGTAVPGTAVQRPFASETATAGTATRIGVNDALFAAAAATSGLAEVSLSELGVQKATDPELKRFSQQMIDEHNRMNQELMNVAAQQRIPVPRQLDARCQFCIESLAGLSGEEFDHCYAKAQFVAHMEAVAAFKAEAERGQNSAMKLLAERSLPHIKDHLKTIKPIAMRYAKEKEEEKEKASEERER